MLAAILAALIPVVVALVTGLLGSLKMPADTTGAVETALDRVLRWIVELITGAEATAGAAHAKTAAALTPSDFSATFARSEFNVAEENLAVHTFNRIVRNDAEAHRHDLKPDELRALRAVPEARIRSRIRDLVSESNTRRNLLAAEAGVPREALTSPAAGWTRLEALAAGKLHADDAALHELLSHWPRIDANEPVAGGDS